MAEQREDKPSHGPDEADSAPQLSEEELDELRRHIKPMKPEDRLPEGKTIITLIPKLNRRTRRD
jgi:hypothetical protein